MDRHHNNLRWDIVGWSVGLLFVAIVLGIFVGIPKYKYAHASASEKCQIDVEKLHDNDKFCNADNEIKSHKAVEAAQAAAQAKAVEDARRAALTPQQRCEEDHKTTSDPDTGDVYIPICHPDGTVQYELASDLQDQLRQDATDSQDSNCNPNYSPCVPNSPYDLDCADIGFSVRVIGTDVYNLDADGDGIGCESYQ